MRLEISREVLAGIRRDAAAAYPLEACGLLFGDKELIRGFETTANVADDPHKGFEIDPTALFAALRVERDGGQRLAGYWHSHPNGGVTPSERDLKSANDDGKLWVILAGGEIAAWRISLAEIYDRVEHIASMETGKLSIVHNYTSSGETQKWFRHVPMVTGDVRDLIPRDKHGIDFLPLIAEAGYPAIAPILGDLMRWTADPNWPIAVPLIEYLATLGDAMVEPIRQVLRGDDDGHKFVCLRGIVRELPAEVRSRLRDDLLKLADVPCEGDWDVSVDEEARDILTMLDDARA